MKGRLAFGGGRPSRREAVGLLHAPLAFPPEEETPWRRPGETEEQAQARIEAGVAALLADRGAEELGGVE